MATQLDICNMALRHVGSTGGQIADLATERSKEAQACRIFYEKVRDEVLRDAAWPFATKFGALALVESQPTAEWLYSYRYPSNCVTFRRILNGETRQETRSTRISFRLGHDDTGELIYTDQANAIGEWTDLITNPGQYDPDFVQAMSLKLAGYIAPSVAGGDQFKLGDRALKMYQFVIATAKENAFNEEQPDAESDSALENSRL